MSGQVLRTLGPADQDVARLRREGYRVGHVEARTRADLLDRVGAALTFPRYWGRNLDALWDCLTDLTGPTALVWVGWDDLAVAAPDDWAAVMAVLTDRVAASPPFTLVLVGPVGAGGEGGARG